MLHGLTALAFLEGIGGPEMVLILFITLILFGGKGLPEMARGLGRSIREFKKAAQGVEDEIKRAMEEPPKKALPPARPPAKSLPATINVTPAPRPTAGDASPEDPKPGA